ncbi:hypothetical protein ACH6YT_28250, partial [Klebsiella pneumoniae]|nr:hypothetical protein [Klebsiella pneumoniae]
MNLTEKSAHLAWCALVALALARQNGDVVSPVQENRHCCKVSDEAAFCLIQRPYISKTLLTRRISP